jgi:hypothetical protein
MQELLRETIMKLITTELQKMSLSRQVMVQKYYQEEYGLMMQHSQISSTLTPKNGGRIG